MELEKLPQKSPFNWTLVLFFDFFLAILILSEKFNKHNSQTLNII